MAKTLRTLTRAGWTTKPAPDLPENRLTAAEVDQTMLDVWDRADSSLFSYRVTDLTNAGIQAALDAARTAGGGVVSIDTPGVYTITNTLLVGSNTTFRIGAGVELMLGSGSPANRHVITNHNTAAGNTNVRIVGEGCVNGNKAGQSGTIGMCCVALVRCTQSEVRGLELKNAYRGGTFPSVGPHGEGVLLVICDNTVVRGVRSHDNMYDGIKIREGRHNQVLDCFSYDNGRSGLQIAYNSAATGFGGTSTENDIAAGEWNFVVAGNQFWHSTGTSSASAPRTAGIYIHNGSFGLIAGNRTRNMQHGLGTYGSVEKLFITGNQFGAREQCVAFETSYSVGNIVQGNMLLGDAANGDWIDDLGVSNIFKDCVFRLSAAGSGTWVVRTKGTGARVVFPEPDNVTVTDTGSSTTVVRIADLGGTPPGPISDADADAIVAAIEATDAGALGSTAKDAIVAFVVSGKTDGWWVRMANLYGFVGGTANSHAIDWRNPSGTTITWTGTVTHSANGVQGGGGHGDSGVTAASALARDNHCLGFYCNASDAATTTKGIIGCGDSSTAGSVHFAQNAAATSYNITFRSAAAAPKNVTESTTAAYIVGNFIGSRSAGSDCAVYKNNVSVASATAVASDATPLAQNMLILSRGASGPTFSGRLALAYWGQSLDSTQRASMHAAVVALQTALGRA